ncbi:MAG: hypothetical protein INQ03_12245 [Candidatus Heimdallarchaeota archaeon]|nr:hypothetical protein [Candidatus Heimdallarchaeota archaeon]
MSTITQESTPVQTGDSIIGAFFIGALFTAVTAVVYGWISQNTTIFGESIIMDVLRQVVIGALFLLLIAIFANYRVLKLLKEHAFTLLKVAIFIQVGIFILLFVGGGLLMLFNGGGTFSYILIAIGGLIALLFFLFWGRLRARIELAAKWLAVASEIVLAEPGMIFLSIIQSIVIAIGLITETIAIYAFNAFAAESELDDTTSKIILYAIAFAYLVFTFFILYYFDGANTYMSYLRIKGQDPTIGQGISRATKMAFSIFVFAVMTSVVKAIASGLRNANRNARNSSGRGGSIQGQIVFMIIAGVVSIAEWLYYLVSFFTLPIIVIRRKSAVSSMQESLDHFKRQAWNIIFGDMGYSWGSNIMYILTGAILAVAGYFYGYFVASSVGWVGTIAGIIMAIIALIFGLSITKFFLRPLYTAFVTVIYVYASEGPGGLKIVSNELKDQIEISMQSPKAIPRNMRV